MTVPKRRLNSRRLPIMTELGLEAIGDVRIRRSPRSKVIRLSFSPYHGLAVVSPVALTEAQLRDIICHHRPWLEGLMRQIASADRIHGLGTITSIAFDAFDSHWTVSFVPDPDAKILRILDDGKRNLSICGPVDDLPRLRKALRRWLSGQATRLLTAAFQACAETHGFEPISVRWRVMRSRWGSCSSVGRICLNSKLLFLSRPQIIYIFLHELCHTRVMNHGPAFYAELSRCLPDHRETEMTLKKACRSLPSWLDGLHG